MHDIGRIIIILGLVIIVVGVIIYLGWGSHVFGWMGRLPGDIRIERENSRFYFPIVTCIVLSILLSAIIRFFMWIRGL